MNNLNQKFILLFKSFNVLARCLLCFFLFVFLGPMIAFPKGHSIITKNISAEFIWSDEVEDTITSSSAIDASAYLVLPNNLIFRELLIESGQQMNIWINNRLVASKIYSCTIPIGQIYTDGNQDTIVLMVEGIKKVRDLKGYLLDLKTISLSKELNGTKKTNMQYDFFIIQVLVLLFVIGLMRRFDLPFLFSLATRPIFFSSRGVVSNFTFKENYKLILRITFSSIFLGLSYWFIENYQPDQNFSLVKNLVSWLIFSCYAFGLLLIKYITVITFGYLHQLKPLSHHQFSVFVNFISGACLFFLIYVNGHLWLLFYEPFVLTKFWNYYFLGAIILFCIYFFLFMSFQKEARKFHIILYLCSTEILGIFYIALILIK